MSFLAPPYAGWEELVNIGFTSFTPPDPNAVTEADPQVPTERLQMGDMFFNQDVNYQPTGAIFVRTTEKIGEIPQLVGPPLPINITRYHRFAAFDIEKEFDFVRSTTAGTVRPFGSGGGIPHPDNVQIKVSPGASFTGSYLDDTNNFYSVPPDPAVDPTSHEVYTQGDGALKHPNRTIVDPDFPEIELSFGSLQLDPYQDPHYMVFPIWGRAFRRRQGDPNTTWYDDMPDPELKLQVREDDLIDSPDTAQPFITDFVKKGEAPTGEGTVNDPDTGYKYDRLFFTCVTPHAEQVDDTYLEVKNDPYWPKSDTFGGPDDKVVTPLRFTYKGNDDNDFFASPLPIPDFYQGDAPGSSNVIRKNQVEYPGWGSKIETITIYPTTDPDFYVKLIVDDYEDTFIDSERIQSFRTYRNQGGAGRHMIDRNADSHDVSVVYRDGANAAIYQVDKSGTPMGNTEIIDFNLGFSKFIAETNYDPTRFSHGSAGIFVGWPRSFSGFGYTRGGQSSTQDQDRFIDAFVERQSLNEPLFPATTTDWDNLFTGSEFDDNRYRRIAAYGPPERLRRGHRFTVAFDNKIDDLTGLSLSADGYSGEVTAAVSQDVILTETKYSVTRKNFNLASISEKKFVGKYPICFSGWVLGGRNMANEANWYQKPYFARFPSWPEMYSSLQPYSTEWEEQGARINSRDDYAPPNFSWQTRQSRLPYRTVVYDCRNFKNYTDPSSARNTDEHANNPMEVLSKAKFLGIEGNLANYFNFNLADEWDYLPNAWCDTQTIDGRQMSVFQFMCTTYPKLTDTSNISVEFYENYNPSTNTYTNLLATYANSEIFIEEHGPFGLIISIPFPISGWQDNTDIWNFSAPHHPFRPIKGFIRIVDGTGEREDRNVIASLDNPLTLSEYECTPAWRLYMETDSVVSLGGGVLESETVGCSWAKDADVYIVGGRFDLGSQITGAPTTTQSFIPGSLRAPSDQPYTEKGPASNWVIQYNSHSNDWQSTDLVTTDWYREELPLFFCYNDSGTFLGNNGTLDNLTTQVDFGTILDYREWKVWDPLASAFVTPFFYVAKTLPADPPTFPNPFVYWALGPSNWCMINAAADEYDGKYRQGIGRSIAPFVFFFIDPLNEKEGPDSTLWVQNVDNIPDTRP